MSAYDTVGWRFVEEAVIRDRGYDEETALSSILQSFFIRRGFVNSLTALNDELAEREAMKMTQNCVAKKACGNHQNLEDGHVATELKNHTNNKSKSNNKTINGDKISSREESGAKGDGDARSGGVTAVLEAMKKRKQMQLMCLNERYEEAAAQLPHGSVLKMKLLAMEAMRRARTDRRAASLFLCEKVSPLIAGTPDAGAAHAVFVDSLAAITGASESELLLPSPRDIALEVNEALVDSHEQSALDVLLSWSEWQAWMRTRDKESQKGSSFPFMKGV
ncbi:hypothetical protein DQ04_10031020 [Trypanosoma grayi]|uniref:hypothetical protein n=1 Tax=Trypanosoma grayi TaxID=71804 RepID=UPI0004F445E6|nr:hypothetical protein DQ04_10031020 [Trypanosoma grayi]KEG07362.1 hypothetical protein DQ04_10031020 [Trypanosoma grayi]